MGRGSRLRLVISDVDMEASRGCHFDYVALYEGLVPVTRSPLARLCGGEEPGSMVLQARGHALTVRWSQDQLFYK